VLQRFEPEEDWVLEAGDMLYLPPGIAHTASRESECLTWSIGFRAPTDAEIVEGFLDHLRDRPAAGGPVSGSRRRATARTPARSRRR
jgi:50S ribosomal protein L16 3-hydroxylase